MGANLWGASPLWEYRPGLIVSEGYPRAEGKGKTARSCLEEAGCKRCEATDRNRIQGRRLRGELARDGISQYHRPVPELDDWI